MTECAEWDCVGCGRHIIAVQLAEPPEHKLCNSCLFMGIERSKAFQDYQDGDIDEATFKRIYETGPEPEWIKRLRNKPPYPGVRHSRSGVAAYMISDETGLESAMILTGLPSDVRPDYERFMMESIVTVRTLMDTLDLRPMTETEIDDYLIRNLAEMEENG